MKILKIITVNILILFSLLIATEFILRISFPNFQLYKRTFPGQYNDRAFDKNNVKVSWPEKCVELGWVCKQDSMLNFSNIIYNKFQIIYRINKEGFRNRQDFSTSNNLSSEKRVMLLGDSFIMSVYIEEEGTIASQLMKKLPPGYQIYNLGIPGYGIDQSVLAYEKYVKILFPNIVLFFYIDDDIPRVLESYRRIEGMNKPNFDILNDKLQIRVNKGKNVFIKILENSYFLNKFYKKYMELYSIEISKKLLENLELMTTARNQKLIVVRCPTKESLLNSNPYKSYSLIEFFKSKNIIYYELYDTLKNLPKNYVKELFLKYDGHPSEEGAKFISEILSNIILNK